MNENLDRKGGDFWGGRYSSVFRLSSKLLGVGLLLHCVKAAATIGSWPPWASHRASAAFTMAAAVPWVPALTVSLMDSGRRIRNIERKRLLSGDTPGGRYCLNFPIRTLGLRPCKLNGLAESLQTSKVSKMSRRTCLGRPARALAYLSFCDLMPQWGRTKCAVPPHRRDKV